MREFPFTLAASTTLTSWPTTTGTTTSPASFQIIDSVNIPAGTYTVQWSVALSGTVGAADANNFALFLGNTQLAISVNAGAAGTYAQASVTFTSPGGSGFGASLNIKTWSGTPTTGATYSATITAGGGTGTAQLGPSFPRESWRVSVASVSVATGTLEAQCKISQGAYAGQTFIDGTTWGSTGDSTSNFSAPVYVGSQVFAVWTGGDPGALATLTLTGTREVP